MKLSKEGKRVECSEMFPSMESFINFVKSENIKINFDSEEIFEKTKTVYDKILNEDGIVICLRLGRWCFSAFGFKNRSPLTLLFWIERGWEEDFAKKNIHKTMSQMSIKSEATKNENKSKIKFNGDVAIIKYKTVYYNSNNRPTCNVCGNELNLITRCAKNVPENFFFEILKCSNENCESHSLNFKEKLKAYLPPEAAIAKLDKMAKTVRETSVLCIEHWLKLGYSEEDAKKEIANIQSKRSKLNKNPFKRTKENLKKRGYTEEEVNEICLTPAQIKFWEKKGYSEEDAKEMVSKNQRFACKDIDFKKRIGSNKIEYWTKKGYSEEEAKLLRSERQRTFNLEKCIKKHGKEEGETIYSERQIKWQKSLNENGNLKKGFSKSSQELFYKLVEKYEYEDRGAVFFATKNEEYKIMKNGGGIWMYDFTDLKQKKIIEYNGDRYHGNPCKFNGDDFPNPFNKKLSAKEIWKKDLIKINKAKEVGFSVLVVWEDEYVKNPEKIIKECLEFLNKK